MNVTAWSPDCGAPFKLIVDQNRSLQVNLARSFWRGVGDIKEAFLPNPQLTGSDKNRSTFYIEEDTTFLLEDDNFFEDISQLYRQQAVLFQRSCDQIKDVYRVDIVPNSALEDISPFGEVSKLGGEDLYSDVLDCLLHMIGCDTKNINKFELYEHLRKAFQIEPKRHLELYNELSGAARRPVKLSLAVVEARDLAGKAVTTTPYCTVYLSSARAAAHTTATRQTTTNPVWNQTFTMEVSPSDPAESLHIEVWNSASEGEAGLGNRLRRLGDTTGRTALKLFISDSTSQPGCGDKVATNNIHNTMSQCIFPQLLGRAEMLVSSLPGCGLDSWMELDSKRGEVHLVQHLYTRQDQLAQHIRLLKVKMHSNGSVNCLNGFVWDGPRV